jgi:hypothetical protein
LIWLTMSGTGGKADLMVTSVERKTFLAPVGSSRTPTVGSAITALTRSSTPSTVSPGRIWKLTTAFASLGRTFSVFPALKIVGAVVVRTSVAIFGSPRSWRTTGGRNSHRFASTSRGPKGSAGAIVLSISSVAPSWKLLGFQCGDRAREAPDLGGKRWCR